MKLSRLFCGALAGTSLLAAACAGNHAKDNKPAAPMTGPAAPSPNEAARVTDSEPDVRDMATREIPELKTVHFPYDSDRLSDEDRGVLRGNADYLKAHSDVRVQIAGNCDQRGTVAYNLALGQRRAVAVRAYYKSLGVDGSRMATISFGKERLLCPESTEECWSRNRRAASLEVVSPVVAGQPALR